MNQIPGAVYNPYAQQMAYVTPAQQPNYNAVKIDVHNPSITTPCGVQPTAPIYDYPQAQQPIYYPPINQPPVYYPPYQPPVCYPPVQPPVPPVQPPVPPVDQPAPTVVTPAPAPTAAAPAPTPAGQINVNGPVVEQVPVPAPVVTVAPAPAPSEPTPAVEPQKPEIVEGQDVAPQVDLNTFIAKLTNPSFEAQHEGMNDIAKLVNDAPDKATELVDTKLFDALTNIINFDSSNLEDATAEQTELRARLDKGEKLTAEEETKARTLSPKEAAETNKCLALYTTAIMDKLYVDEVSKLSNNNSVVPLTDLPGATTLVDNLKDNPNAMVRACAIEALSHLSRPEYKADLQTVFNVARNDSDSDVKAAAELALEKLQ